MPKNHTLKIDCNCSDISGKTLKSQITSEQTLRVCID
jgi:hypothetical protein